MDCICYKQENRTDRDLSNDYVLTALEKIRENYLSIKNDIITKDRELKILREGNEKLTKALQLLQRDKPYFTISQQSPQRKRKARTDNLSEKPHSSLHDESLTDQDTCIVNADVTADDLNMALNSEQISSCSSNDTTQVSPIRSEIIFETENVRSPRMLHTSFEQRRKKKRLRMTENRDPLRPVKKNDSGWLCKERDGGSSRQLVRGDIKADFSGSFMEPPTIGGCKNNQMSKLSLKKPRKLKQSRLQLELTRRKPNNGCDSFSEDVIDSSPNPHSMLNPAKSARSWLLRVNNNSKCAGQIADKSNQPVDGSSGYDIEEDVERDFENVFNFTLKPSTPQNNNTSKISAPAENLSILEEADKEATKQTNDCNSSFPSVMILTPATPDIIFVDDDSFNFTANIESMDLLEEVLKNGGECLDNLKRMESENIKKLQKTASLASNIDTGYKSNQPLAAQLHQIKQEKAIQESPDAESKMDEAKRNLFDETSNELEDFMPKPFLLKLEDQRRDQRNINNKTATAIRATTVGENKQGKLTLEPMQTDTKTADVKRNLFDESNNDLEDFMPQPLKVKVENQDDKESKKDTKDTNLQASKSKPFNLREKFNIDCRDCQQYINFLGDRMTDEQIREHLRRCMRHKPREAIINPTPEGFWDPFIPSFDSNDSRNETLIDTRFQNKQI